MNPSDPNHVRRDPVAEFNAKARARKRKSLKNQLIATALLGGILFVAAKFLLPLSDSSKPDSSDSQDTEVNYEVPKEQVGGDLEVSSIEVEVIDEKDGQKELDLVEIKEPEPEAFIENTQPESKLTASEKLAAENEFVLVGMDSNREQALLRDQETLEKVFNEGTWNAYRSLLQKSIVAALAGIEAGSGLNQFDPLLEQPILYQAFLRWSVLGWFSESEIKSVSPDSYSGKFFEWILTDNEAMEELLLVIKPEDDAGKVLEFLNEAWTVNEEKYEEYFPLALACAVVFDRPMRIPHALESSASESQVVVDPIRRYIWYFENNEKGRFEAPVNRMSARDLVWVVCAPVVTSELDWAIRKVRLSRASWGRAYGMVNYLMERAVEGLDPYEEYSFEEILKEGGICGDQSYFCVNTARANGIPGMIITGETSGGPHAWAGLKIDSREWSTGVGRIGGVSKGQTSNPQTSKNMTEQEIQLWNDRLYQSSVVTLNVHRLLWLSSFFEAVEKPEERAAAVRIANHQGHSFLETWQALYSLLEDETELVGEPEKPGNLEAWKAFAQDMRRKFLDNPRIAGLASEAEMKYIFPYGSAGDAKRSFIRERRRIERESGEQMDLVAESLKREADLMLQRGDADAEREIMQLYDGALRDYGQNITGFKMMARDYFSFFNEDQENGRKAARDVELAFKRVVESDTTEWFRAKTEASILDMICAFYRKAGDSDRADLLERRNEVRMRRAKRRAD